MSRIPASSYVVILADHTSSLLRLLLLLVLLLFLIFLMHDLFPLFLHLLLIHQGAIITPEARVINLVDIKA